MKLLPFLFLLSFACGDKKQAMNIKSEKEYDIKFSLLMLQWEELKTALGDSPVANGKYKNIAVGIEQLKPIKQ